MEDGCKGVHQLGEGATGEEADLKNDEGTYLNDSITINKKLNETRLISLI
jgi:hypothetical protein